MRELKVGTINNYDVMLFVDPNEDLVTVLVHKSGQNITVQRVAKLKSFVHRAKMLRFGWAKLPDDEVIYIYDKADDNFGYAVNLCDPNCSEWGYAPFWLLIPAPLTWSRNQQPKNLCSRKEAKTND